MNIFALLLAILGSFGFAAAASGGGKESVTVPEDIDSDQDDVTPVVDNSADVDADDISDTEDHAGNDDGTADQNHDMDGDHDGDTAGHDDGGDTGDTADHDDDMDHGGDTGDTTDHDDDMDHDHGGDTGDTADHDDDLDHEDGDVQVEGTPIILVFGQSNAANLSSSHALIDAVTEAGGSAIEVNVSGGGQSVSLGDGAWNLIQGDGEDAQGESYVRLLEAMAAIYEATPDAYISNAVWVQGEADAHGVKAINYYNATFELFTQMREDLGDDFPISIVGLSDYQNLGEVGRNVVLDAQVQLAEDLDDVYFVDTNAIIADNDFDEEFVMNDNLHYSAEFFDEIANAILEEPAVRASLQLDGPSDDDADHDHDHDDDTDMSDVTDMPLTTIEEIETFVEAVKSAPEAHAHDDNSSMMAEHMAALDLVDREEATHIAIRDGDWDDPDTWYLGEVPDDDARVVIPEGIHVDYATVSDARIFTLRVDGELEFATDTDSSLTVDTMVLTTTGKLTIGTEETPVEADVNVDIIFANNGPIDVEWDPMLLSRGLISHGEVTIHGDEKDSHEKVIDDPMAGDTSVNFADIPTGWAEGDTIVIAGTHYEGYYDTSAEGGYEPSEDEVRIISAIEGDTVHFDVPLDFDHDSPREDLKTSVANYTRNVSLETEDADLADISERGHVMFMHNDDVDVRFVEFLGLGRTDKSEDSFAASDFDDIQSDSNVQGRYSVHIHQAGTESGENPAILEGNAVFGSPGWGFVHHDSHAILTNNASFDTFGAGYVAETGNETGAWNDNIAIFSQGLSWNDPKGINAGSNNANDFDMGRSGDGFWFQGRMVESSDNVAASVHNGFVYFHRGPVGEDGLLPFDSETTELESLFNYDDQILADEHPIIGFNGNETFAAKSGIYVLKAWFTQGHAVSTVLEDFTAWSVQTGADLSYTGHYTLIDFDLVARDDSDISTNGSIGIDIGNNVIDLTIVDANLEGFTTGIDLQKVLTGDLPSELHNYAIVNPTFIDVQEHYSDYDPALDTIINHDDLANLKPDVELDGPLVYNHTSSGGEPVNLTGTRFDTLGEADFVDGDTEFKLSPDDVRNILEEQGYFTTSEGEQYFVLDVFFSDRISGDIYVEKHPVFVAEGSGLGEEGNWWFRNVEHNGVQDFDTHGDTTSDEAELWAALVDGQLVLSDDMPEDDAEDDMDHDLH